MDSCGLNYGSLDALQAASEIPREHISKLNRRTCEEVYVTFNKIFKEAYNSRGDLEKQYSLFMRCGELAKIIKDKNGFQAFLCSKKEMPATFGEQFRQCITQITNLQTLLSKKYDERKLRENTTERASQIDAISSTKETSETYDFLNPLISPKDLVRLVERGEPKKSAIIFDYREYKDERINYSKENLISVIRIPHDMIQPNLIYTALRSKLEVGQRVLLSRINACDFVVLMEDQTPRIINGEPAADSNAKMLFKALYEYPTAENRPKRRPLYMDGGFSLWRAQYPMYTQSENGSCKPRDDLDNCVEKYKRDCSLNEIKFPDIIPTNISNQVVHDETDMEGINVRARFPTAGSTKVSSTEKGLPSELSINVSQPRNGQRTETPLILPLSTIERGPEPFAHSSAGSQARPSFDRTNKPSTIFPQADARSNAKSGARNGLQNGDGRTDGADVPTLVASSETANIPILTQKRQDKLCTPSLDRATKPTFVTPELAKSLLEIYSQMSRALQSGSKRSTPSPGYTGLYNMGNTCFMSATLQCLFHTPQLCDIFTKENFLSKVNPQNKLGTKGVISAVFSSLMDIVWSGNYSAIRPQRFLQLFADQVNSSLADGQQHDASEFQLFLLDALHEDTNQVVQRVSFEQNYQGGLHIVKDANDYCTRSRQFAFSTVNKILNIQSVSELSCITCNASSATFEESTLLSVELPQVGESTLTDCLRAHFSKTRLEGDCSWNCPKCKKARPADRSTKLWTLPSVLVIHLKRFSLSNGEYVKNNAAVAFESRFDVGSYLHPSAPRPDDATYKLYAITNHVGRLNSGHYTAIVSHLRNGKWLRFDDESVCDAGVSSGDFSAQVGVHSFLQTVKSEQNLTKLAEDSLHFYRTRQ